MAVGAPGRGSPSVAGTLTSGSAWSTIKVPIALALLDKVHGPSGLDANQKSAMERALTQSDNAAAAALFGGLGASGPATAAVQDELRKAGDGGTQVSTKGRDGFSPYGQTEWPLAAQERFMAALAGGCISTSASRGYVLGLMGRVTSDRWGLGSVGVPARWKGGWGPGTDGKYLARQMGVVTIDGKPTVVLVAARAGDGQFASAQSIASAAAKWVVGHVRRPSGGGC